MANFSCCDQVLCGTPCYERDVHSNLLLSNLKSFKTFNLFKGMQMYLHLHSLV